jgi:hypothetical protein
MKILVCTSLTQGRRPNDFCFAPEEEIVRFGVEHQGEDVDGVCGCRRAMHGINTNRATTTVKVVETKLIREEFRRLIATSFRTAYSRQSIHPDESDLTQECAELMADYILATAAEFQVGQVLERRGTSFEVREDEWADTIE